MGDQKRTRWSRAGATEAFHNTAAVYVDLGVEVLLSYGQAALTEPVVAVQRVRKRSGVNVNLKGKSKTKYHVRMNEWKLLFSRADGCGLLLGVETRRLQPLQRAAQSPATAAEVAGVAGVEVVGHQHPWEGRETTHELSDDAPRVRGVVTVCPPGVLSPPYRGSR